jgi:hypothetical protein
MRLLQMLTYSQLEAWLTVPDLFELQASSLLPQAYICLG